MTDNEIIKALMCCIAIDCDCCPYCDIDHCCAEMIESTLDLINRQKTEIEKLKWATAQVGKPCTELMRLSNDESNGNRIKEVDAQIILSMARNGMKVKCAAEQINYARSTVDYHLKKIHRVTGLDARDFFDLCKLVEMVNDSYGGDDLSPNAECSR